MRYKTALSIFFLVLSTSVLLSQATTSIPDETFENYLETHAADGTEVPIGDATSMGDGISNNSTVFSERINDVVLLDVSGLNISDLTGIADFSSLENLFCSDNNLDELNVTNNLNLISLLCGSNNLSDLDVSSNLNLETLNCADNQIQSIDVSVNILLRSLTVSGNQISTIDVSSNPDLSSLSVSNNRLVGPLVVSNNSNLESLFCASNQISELDLTSNTLLRNLDASDNALTDLDLSAINSVVCPDPQTDPITTCQGPASINVSRNQLESLIVANGFNDLISSLNTTDNPDLYCIQTDIDFVPPSAWIKDDWTYYSDTVCDDIYTYVPDDNFEQALITLGTDDILDNLVLTANIENLIDLNISNLGIQSLEGIEDFLALQILDCSTNSIERLDLSANISLLELDVTNNDLTQLELNSNTNLTTLFCASNFLASMDLIDNTDLTLLNCSNNELTDLEVTNNTLLTDLDCSFNQIQRLDLGLNTALTSVLVNDNNLFALNLDNGTNTAITTFNATTNANLFCIKVDDVVFSNTAANWQKDASANYNTDCGTYVPDDNFEQALIDQNIDSDATLNNFVATADINSLLSLDVQGLVIEDLTGIEDFLALQNLNCSDNLLTNLDLNTNTALINLDVSNNLIEALVLTANTALTSINCSTNALTVLTIENGNNNIITNFDTTDNPRLFCITIDDALMGAIPMAWQKDLFAQYNGDCNNRFTAIPDPFFEQVLIDLGYDDVIDSQVLTSNIEVVQNLDISGNGISELTGIQDFKLLNELDCSGNFLEELNVSNLLFLERLNCSSNFLLTNDITATEGVLNIDGTVGLRELFCAGNNLNSLDTSQNVNLEVLDCADNNLATLNIVNNPSLRLLNGSNNGLIALDLSSNTALEDVNCDNNQITDLNTTTTNNTTLSSLSCANNDLETLVVSSYSALRYLNCDSNALTELDLDSNLTIEYVSSNSNQISDINLSNNTNLIALQLSQNELTQVDLTANIMLENLNINFNDIMQLDLSLNSLLKVLSATNNQLEAIDLSSNLNLIECNISSNLLNSITFASDLGTLKALNLSNNQLNDGLDLTTMALNACPFQTGQSEFCPETIGINVSNNLLGFLNIQNGINSDITNLNATSNPNLTCIQVDDSNAIGAGWLKDDMAQYNEDCNFGETFVPDDNFEQRLIDLGLDSGPLNDYVLTENIEGLINLDISGLTITDLTGIQDFSALENLNVSNNALSELNVAQNTSLINFDCSTNDLLALDLLNNTALVSLNCSNNAISGLDLSANSSLTTLDISSNTFTSFLPNNVPALEQFNCGFNQIIALDFQQNQNLIDLICQSNQLNSLNIRNGQNSLLANLDATNNPDLVCVESDTGEVPTGATWTIDPTAQFAINCFFGQTLVPDDNFEQALIDFGLDSGALDDYVLTEVVEDVPLLNLSEREISDLTGIEAFKALTNLNFQSNAIVNVDLSANVALVNLDGSDNLLTTINLSTLQNLQNLDLANNEILQLDLSGNLELEDLDISNNQLSSLEIGQLLNLQQLNAAINNIASLDFTLNPNLTQLFCQSNALIADQLNLQNGNNENLLIFNATDNPDLGCILVDNPTAVIANTDGFYDSWFKDDTASYQSICEDADNDGVPNADDLCPSTDFGATVDLFGCAIIDLPSSNFTVSVTGETCLNSNNGQITIAAQELYNYTVSLFSEDFIEPTGEDFYQEYNFTNDIDIFNLLAGTYDMCITIEEWPDYQNCYTILITEPDPLTVFASRSASESELYLELNGGTKYHIQFNDEFFTTFASSVTLNLQHGINTIKITTDLECQGIYEEKIELNPLKTVYPNPFKEAISIAYGTKGDQVDIVIYSPLGQVVLKTSVQNNGDRIDLNTSHLKSGMYMLVLRTEKETQTFKIVKD